MGGGGGGGGGQGWGDFHAMRESRKTPGNVSMFWRALWGQTLRQSGGGGGGGGGGGAGLGGFSCHEREQKDTRQCLHLLRHTPGGGQLVCWVWFACHEREQKDTRQWLHVLEGTVGTNT